MFKITSRFLFMALMVALLSMFSGSAMAQEEAVEMDAETLIQQFLPEGVTIADATDEQLSSAVSQAVSANPQAAGQIVATVARINPAQVVNATAAATSAAPDQAAAITQAAVTAAPDQAENITAAATQAAPQQTEQIQTAAQQTSRVQAAQQGIQRATQQATESGDSPPARDDSPASPTQ